jgi:hypothetical protein
MIQYNFYIDKNKDNKYNNYIDVKLDHPIICYDDEYLKIKILDIQYLNNLYNVSSKLQNNIIKINRTTFIYDQQPSLMDILEDIYDTTQTPVIYNSSTVLSYDTDNDIQFITGTNFKIHYKDFQIIDGVDSFDNIFYGTTPIELKFNEFDNYIIVEKLDNNNTDYLRQFSYGIKKTTANNLSQDETFRMIVQGSYDNISYFNIPIMIADSELITFTPQNIQNAIIDRVRINLINRINYKYYKFSLNASFEQLDPLINGFKLNSLKLFSWTQQPYTIGSNTTTDLIIPDGFYKSTTYISKIKELLTPYNVDITLNSLNNKVNITHNLVDTITYPFTDPNGLIILQFTTLNIRNNIGIYNEFNTLIYNNAFVGDTNIDLVNFKKIILTTNLDFTNKTHNDLIGGNTAETGVGNILLWIDNDEAPFTCIKYKNYEDSSYRIENKTINNILFTIYNEKTQKLDLDNMLIHFEIQKFRLK